MRELGVALRQKRVTSVGLTKMYLARLRRYDPLLKFVITYTDDRALKQAAQADQELASMTENATQYEAIAAVEKSKLGWLRTAMGSS